MSNRCRAAAYSCSQRWALLDSTGAPDPGASNMYISNSLVSFSATPEIKTGAEVEQLNACGDVCVNIRKPDVLKWWNVEIQICKPDPELSQLLAGGTVLTNGDAVGWASPFLNDPDAFPLVSAELWVQQYLDDGSLDPDFPYVRFVFPKLQLRPGAETYEAGPVLRNFAGIARENENWGNGPANDWPVVSDRALLQLEDDDAPTAQCGFVNLPVS